MGMHITPQESSALYGLLADHSSDIILKTDREGFILHASQAIERLGFAMPAMLIGPHLLDLVDPSCAEMVRAGHDAALAGRQDGGWIEFPALTADRRKRWFEIQIRCLPDARGQAYGALSVMRSIDERRVLEDKLFAAELTDPLTGLTNRKAFIAMLRHLVDERVGGCLALFDIDYFKAINMQYGQSAGDRVLVVFADLLRTMMRQEDIISRIGGECLAVMLPRTAPQDAQALCQRIIDTLADLRADRGSDAFTLTASAGIACIGKSLDETIKRAELSLFLAKAKGRGRLELDSDARQARRSRQAALP